MKTRNLLILIVLAILMSCTSKPKNPIEGTWNLVSFKFTFPDSTFLVGSKVYKAKQFLDKNHDEKSNELVPLLICF